MSADAANPTAKRLHDAIDAGAPFVTGGGETGALIRSIDWRTTLLGPANGWPQSLRTSLSICLSSRFPIALYWGPRYVMLYNDDLLPMVGANKHPWAMGRPAFEVLPEIRAVIEPMLDRVVGTGQAIWSEDLMLPLVRGDAPEEGYFTFTYSPIRDESGGVGGVFCAVLETTDKVIEERRLRLLNALADVTQAKTPDEACSLAAAQIARAPNDVPFALLYLLDEASSIARLAGAANIEPGTARSPLTIAPGDVSTWPFDPAMTTARAVSLDDGPRGARGAVILPIERAGGGQPLGFIVAGLSPLLRASGSYERFHNLLSASISQGVSNAAAYEAEKQRAESLAELDRAKTTFFSNVSHEFRTPLTLMLGPIQDLLGMPDGAAADRGALELLQRNALRLTKLVNTLLEFSRIEAGRVEAVYEPVDLSLLTSDLASAFRAAVEGAGMALVVECPPLSEPVYVDREMWEKIVLNLLSNAFKFTFQGSIAVRLGLTGDHVSLQIADTGTGIEEHEIPRLFERFHRVEGARSRTHEGSGIGLALIHELVRLHGGEIGVASRAGAGTTFTVRLRRGRAHLPPSRIGSGRGLPATALGAKPFVEEAESWGRPSSQGGEGPDPLFRLAKRPEEGRILFADDNADMRDYVARLLRERWDVETVHDGVEALESMRRDPPALLLCDVMMPRLDGFSLVKATRADPALRAIPIVVLSARAGEDEAAMGLGSGANDYIAKPFSARELLVRVASNLAAARGAHEREISQVRAREETERAMVLLQAATAERTRALEEAKRASRAKDEFLSTMSHELRTPLNAIVGWSKLLRAGNVSDTQIPRALEAIERNALLQSRLIEDMLDLARIEQGKVVLSVGPTEMVRVVEAALDAVRPAAELKGVRLQPVLDSHATIVGDADRLQQVVWNLLSNAIKFTPRGGRVQLRLRRLQSYVELAVADDGEGIDPAFMPYVFDRFRQADAKTSRKAGGLGLGLAIVRSIVELHGGIVSAQSDGEGHGATFTVRLPVAPLRADASAQSPSHAVEVAAKPAVEFPPSLEGTRILVVDDESETRDLLQYLLQECGCVVTVVDDPSRAPAVVRSGAFDVLVSDIGMPGVDGYAVIRQVRELPPEKGGVIPAIALTGYARSEDRTLALRAGFDMHLTKPIEPAELLAVIASLVEGVRRRRA